MESEVMLACSGGKLMGPVSPAELLKKLDDFGQDVQFVISPRKGWVPIDTYLSEIRGGTNAALDEETAVTDGAFRRTQPFKAVVWWILGLLIACILGGLVWWLIRSSVY